MSGSLGAELARGVVLGVVAYGAALAGVLMLALPDLRVAGALLLLAAGVLGVIAWGGQPRLAPFGLHPWSFSVSRLRPIQMVSLGGMAAAGVVSLLASAQWSQNTNEPFGLAGWLWLLSIGLLAGSAAVWPRPPAEEGRIRPLKRIIVGTWRNAPWRDAIGTRRTSPQREPSSDTIPAIRKVEQTQGGELPWTSWEVVVFAGIVLLTFGLRLWELDKYPVAIHPDEILTANNAIGAFGSGQRVSVFSTIWYGIDLPALWFAGVFASLEWGGHNLAVLRLPAALLGAATVFPLYGLVRGAWGRTAAITAALVMAVSISHVHYSRVTLNNIVTPFFWAACFYFLLRGLQTRHPLHWALAGLIGGLGEYFYYGTRLLFLLLIAFALYLLVAHWRRGWTYLWHMAALALGFLVGFGPLLAYFLRNPGLYFGRGGGVLTWDHIPTSWADLALMWNTLWPIIEQNLLTIAAIPANDSVYFAQFLLPLEAALLVLGVALLVWRWRQPAAFLVLLSAVAVLFVGGTLIPSAGNTSHWTPAFPQFYAIIGAPVGAWAASRGWDALPRRWRLALPIAVAAGLAVIAVLNIDYYFNKYGAIRPEFELRALQARYQAALGTGYIVRNVGPTWQPYDPTTNSYLIKGQDGAQINDPATELPVPNREGKGLAFFFFPDNEQNLPLVRSLYPGGTEETVNSYTKAPMFKVYKLDPVRARAAYGAQLVVTGPDELEASWLGKVPRFGVLPEGLEFPLQARWSGRVYIGDMGEYNLKVEGVGGATILVDGQPFDPSQRVLLQPGWRRVVVEAQLDAPAQPTLLWAVNGGEFTPVPDGYSWPKSDQ